MFIKINLELYPVIFKMFLKQLSIRLRIKFMIDADSKESRYISAFKIFKTSFKKINKFLEFSIIMLRYNRIIIGKCWSVIHKLESYGYKDVNIFGSGSIAEILCVLSKYKSININAVYDEVEDKRKILKWDVLPLKSFKNSNDYIIIAEVVDVDNMKDTLKKLGVKDDKIIVLGEKL